VRRGPPRLADWLTALLLLGGLAVSAAPRAGEAPQPTRVRDLYYGEALFHFFSQDDFSALTHLLAARDAGRVPHHEAESELLLGGLYLGYGQHAHAEEIFERLLAGNARPAVRDRAWFYLGKLRYQRGLYPEALAALGRVGPELPESLAAELPMLVAQSWMAQGEFARAQQVLASWEAPDSWLAYARYNLGVALVRLGRMTEGAALLDRVGSMATAGSEQKSLRDKANLALGYAWLQAGDAAAARPVLQRVRLRGPFASKALLGAGWAEAAGENYSAALVPWLELMDRDLLDSAVQESFLAVPYALGRLAAHGSAVERYERALGTFDAEIARLDAAISRARSGALIPALLADDDAALSRWYWRLQAVPDSSDSRYLYHLLADHSFQESFKNYRDLAALSRNLDDWQERLAAYTDMVEARAGAYRERLPATQARLSGVDVRALQQRRDALAARLTAAAPTRDVVALATEAERDQWQRLQAIGALPALQDPANADARLRHRLLSGVLAWDLDREFKLRAWRAQRGLRELDAALELTGTRLAAVSGAQTDEPRRFDGFAGRISALAPRIGSLRAAVGRTLQREETRLVALAVGELEAQQQRLASYRVQARFALAAIYDRAGVRQTAALPPAETTP